MTTTAPPSLEERLAAARTEEEAAKERLNKAETALRSALDSQDFGTRAEKLHAERERAREALLIASAHAEALQSGMSALVQQRDAERLAQAERERVEHAKKLFEEARGREAEALEEMERHLAQVGPAYEALRRVMQAALDAEHRLGNIRAEVDQLGKAAGHFDPGLPAPPRPNQARSRFASSDVLSLVMSRPAPR